MAARKRAKFVNEQWRSRIQTSMLINRLEDHIVGKISLETTQIKAIEILLRKVAPDLSQVDSNVTIENPQANVFPMGLPDEHDKLPAASEAVDSVH